MAKVTLLTNEERSVLPMVIARRNRFKNIIKVSLENYDKMFSNCLMIQGKPGTGKTTTTVQVLEALKEEGIIAGYRQAAGHITPRSMYRLLKETAVPENGLPNVLLLDDIDALGDEGCLELMKSAFDSLFESPTNRNVFYQTEDGGTGFKYRGFGIIICNNDFGSKKTSVHQDALLDRVQQLSIDLQPNDMMIFTTHLVEKYINSNINKFSADEIKSIVELYNTDIRKWMNKDAFRKARVNYSIRLIRKFVEAQRIYGDGWKDFNISYQKLEAASLLEEVKETPTVQPSPLTTPKRVVKKSSKTISANKSGKKSKFDTEPKKNKAGKYVDKKGNVYPDYTQYYLRKKFAA